MKHFSSSEICFPYLVSSEAGMLPAEDLLADQKDGTLYAGTLEVVVS